MTLSVADIERWDAGDVREVFHAASSRAQAAFDAADGLAELPALTTWGGVAAEAARQAIGRTRKDLDSHGNEALTVADAARRAAESIEAIQSDLAQLKADAAGVGLEVDASSNRIVPIPGTRRTRRQLQHDIPPLQTRLNSLVEEANSVDDDLATAIHLADGTTPLAPSLHANDPEAQQALAGPLPDDPSTFAELWKTLSREDRDLLYSRDHAIGNHAGMLTGDKDTFDADHYNRLYLDEALRQYTGPKLQDMLALKTTLDKNPDARLMFFDPEGGVQVHAAVSVGDPDTAENISVTTPGLNTTVRGGVESMVGEAKLLQRQALLQLGATPGRENEKVAAIAWMGYDAPQLTLPDTGDKRVPGLPDAAAGLNGLWEVSHDTVAKGAAVDLAKFYDGITAAHGGKPLNLTAVGHSYGSLTTGLALQQPGNHGVDSAVFYGSPGIEAGTPADLQLQPGRVFAMAAPDDRIPQLVYEGPPIAKALTPILGPLAPGAQVLLAGAEATGAGQFGPNPATNPNFVQMETAAVVPGDGHNRNILLDAASGHSEYPRAVAPGSPAQARTTVYNIAAVVAGLDDNVITPK